MQTRIRNSITATDVVVFSVIQANIAFVLVLIVSELIGVELVVMMSTESFLYLPHR